MGVRGVRYALALGAALAVGAFAVPASSAGLLGTLLPSCGVETHPFAQWGDPDAYCAFPNVGFENGTAGWTAVGNASIVSANEPWYVSGSGASALQLGPGASVLSSPLPVNLLDPWLRFFAESGDGAGRLQVIVIFRGLLGNLTGLLNYGSLSADDYSTWQPTQRISSLLALPVGTSSVQVLITNASRSGSWLVDDVYLDPCVSRVG